MDPHFEKVYRTLFDQYEKNNDVIPPQGRERHKRNTRRRLNEFRSAKRSSGTSLGTSEDWIRIIKLAISGTTNAFKKHDIHIRADAKYFLLVNFHHLIVLPLINDPKKLLEMELASADPSGEIIHEKVDPIKVLTTGIKVDIKSIIHTAVKRNANSSEISGHQIMATIDSTWKNLQLTSLDIWG